MAFPAELAAKIAAMQQVQFWAVYMEPQSSWNLNAPELHDALASHIAWLERLEAEGTLSLSGPIDLPNWNGTGMAILRSESIKAAAALAETEPFHVQGFRKNVVKPWNVNEGTVISRAQLLSGKGQLS